MQLLSLFLHVWTPPPICGDEYDLANCGNKEIQCDRGCEREKGCLWEFTISMHACLWGWGGGVWKKVGGTMCVGAFDWRNANLKSHKDDFGLIWFARAAAQGYPFPPFSFNLLGLDSYSSQRALTVHMFFFFYLWWITAVHTVGLFTERKTDLHSVTLIHHLFMHLCVWFSIQENT